MEKVLIVEAPKKVKTLQKILGPDFHVVATGGHIMDLPLESLGVDIAQDFKVDYAPLQGKQKSIGALRSLQNSKAQIYICTDADREGERIGAHAARLTGLSLSSCCRVTYGSLTKEAVMGALATPRNFDVDLLEAQEARRVVDRLMGYLISKWLWKMGDLKGDRLRAAGRVQSAVLNLVVSREEQIESFTPRTHYLLKLRPRQALLKNSPADLVLVEADGSGKMQPVIHQDLLSINMALEAYNLSEEKDLVEIKRQDRTEKLPPPPALITSSLLKAGCNAFGWTPAVVMQVAQDLYADGHITYIRTDNPNMAGEFLPSVKELLASQGLQHLWSEEPNVYPSPAGAQEAHEAIRPTDLSVTGEGLPEKHGQLYRLIRMRSVVAAACPAILQKGTELFRRGSQHFQRHFGSCQVKGWLELAEVEPWAADFKSFVRAADLPQPPFPLEDLVPLQYPVTSQKPPRYTTATLTAEMEKLEIGRPSTYATVFLTLEKHKYISYSKKSSVVPSKEGRLVIKLLREKFGKFIDPGYTREVEADLDKIAAGSLNRLTFLNLWYHDFVAVYDAVMGEVEMMLQHRPKPGFVST
jgi:DNA topoisomerase-1